MVAITRSSYQKGLALKQSKNTHRVVSTNSSTLKQLYAKINCDYVTKVVCSRMTFFIIIYRQSLEENWFVTLIGIHFMY